MIQSGELIEGNDSAVWHPARAPQLAYSQCLSDSIWGSNRGNISRIASTMQEIIAHIFQHYCSSVAKSFVEYAWKKNDDDGGGMMMMMVMTMTTMMMMMTTMMMLMMLLLLMVMATVMMTMMMSLTWWLMTTTTTTTMTVMIDQRLRRLNGLSALEHTTYRRSRKHPRPFLPPERAPEVRENEACSAAPAWAWGALPSEWRTFK